MELPLCPFCKQKPHLQNHNIYVKCSTKTCPLHSVDFLLDEWRRLDSGRPDIEFPESIAHPTMRERYFRECMDIVSKCSVRDPSPSGDKNSYVVPTRLVLQSIEKAIYQ